MCGRFNNGSELTQIREWSNILGEWPDISPNYNVAPSTQITAFRSNQGELMRWGMIPSWSSAFKSKYATFNARIETVDEKPSFRSAWKNAQTCLIPMAGYYEWTGRKGNKQPFYITDRNVGIVVAAGLYEQWGDDELSCTMLTMPANAELKNLHPRMPIMLNPDNAYKWLNGNCGKQQLTEQDVPNVIYYPVALDVGDVQNNHPELIQPIDI